MGWDEKYHQGDIYQKYQDEKYPSTTAHSSDRENPIFNNAVKQVRYRLFSFWTAFKHTFLRIRNSLLKMSLRQSELHLFKLQTLNTGELQLKFLCKFFVGEKVGPSLEKKELIYMLKASRCKEHTVMAASTRASPPSLGEEQGSYRL